MPHDTTGSARQRKPDSAKIKIKGSWTAIPNKLLKDHRLSRDARLLGCLIFMHAANSGRAFPSQEKMAEELGCTRRSIIRWLEELQLVGWVEWQHTIRNNAYTLKDPDETLVGVPLSQPNDESTVTQESHHVIAVSHPHATQRSQHVTQESHSDVTQRSAHMTQESHSYNTDSYDPDSYNTDSSSSDTIPIRSSADGDDVPTPTELFLQEENLGVAHELRELPLELARQYVAEAKQRSATLPAIAQGLRARWKREQARRQRAQAEAVTHPPDWIDAAIWPTLPADLQFALEGSSIDDEGYLCYDGRHEAAMEAHAEQLTALLAQARREHAVSM